MIDLSRRGAVAVLTLSRPPVNAIDDAMISAFHGHLDTLVGQPDWQALHVRSNQRVFAAGADLDLIRSWAEAASPRVALSGYIDRLQGLYQRIERLPQVTVAEINGAAMGGGFELALSCDLRIAANEAKIGLPEVGIGLLPGAGGTQRLTRLCGPGVASRVILGAEPVDGATAFALGMVEWTFPRTTLESEAGAIVDRLSLLPAHAQQAAKQCIGAADSIASTGYLLERDFGGALLDSDRTQELIKAFLERSARK